MLRNHMTPFALPQRLEKKEEKKPVDWAKALYPPNGKPIENYPIQELKNAERQIKEAQEKKNAAELNKAKLKKDYAKAQLQPFKDQFFKLLISLETWAKQNACYDEVKDDMNTFRTNIFHEAYTGDQSELYFTTIKMNLEKIWFQLRNSTIPIEKRKKIFTELCPQLAVCGPGVYGHIQDAALRLESRAGVEAWLAANRAGIVQYLASRHIEANQVRAGMQVHVHNRFNREGEKHFGLPTRVSDMVDVYEHSAEAKISNQTMQQFKENFLKEYTPLVVVDCVTSNLCDEIAKIKKENNIKEDKDGRFPYDGNILKQFQALFKRHDLEKLQESIIFEMEEPKEGQYFLRFSPQKLREQVAINSGLFDERPIILPNGHMYFVNDYIPASNIDNKETKLSPSHTKNWDSIPSQDIYQLFVAIEEASPKFIEWLFSNKHSSSLQPIVRKVFNEAIERDNSALINKLLLAGGTEFAKEMIRDFLELSAEKKDEILKSLQDFAIQNIQKKGTKEEFKGFVFFKEHKELQEAKKLCQHVVYGDYDQVKAMLEKNPRLLLYKTRVEDYSFGEEGDKHREIEGTAYQMALGAGDVNRTVLDEKYKPVLDAKGNIQILHKEEGMAEMIRSYFIKACSNNENKANATIQQQQEEQFPGGYDAYQKSNEVQDKKANDLKALKKVIAAIAEANVSFTRGNYNDSKGEVNVDAKCEAALKEFREYLKPKGPIKRGEHFNIDLLIEAFKLYDDKKRYNDFDTSYKRKITADVSTWDSPKNVLMWRKVVGYILRFLPACYAQVCCQSIRDVIHCEQKLIRSLKFRYDDALFFPLDSDPSARLGFQFAAGVGESGWGGIWPSMPLTGGRCWGFAHHWETCVEQKQYSIGNLCQNVPTIAQRKTSAQ